MGKSSIEWTEQTWNPTLGCTEQSRGCMRCYAARMAYRLSFNPKLGDMYKGLTKKLPNGKVVWTGDVKLMEDRLEDPFHIKKPQMFFVNSMSDLFHPAVPYDFIAKVFTVMALTPRHTYQILTKFPDRAADFFEDYPFGMFSGVALSESVFEYFSFIKSGDYKTTYTGNEPLENVWLGTSVENTKELWRIDELMKCPAKIRFLSMEPLVEVVSLEKHLPIQCLGGPRYTYKEKETVSVWPNWIIVGGESGSDGSPMHPNAVGVVRDQCAAAKVAFFFKQWGNYVPCYELNKIPYAAGTYHKAAFECHKKPDYTFSDGTQMIRMGKHNAGRTFDGRTYDEYPVGTKIVADDRGE